MEVSCACPVARRLKTCGPVLNSPFGTCHDEITRTAVAMINGRAIHLPQLCQNLYFLGCILIYPPEFTRPTWTNLPQTISFLLAKSTNIRRSRPLPILIRTWSILGPAVMQFRATPGDQVFPPWVPGPIIRAPTRRIANPGNCSIMWDSSEQRRGVRSDNGNECFAGQLAAEPCCDSFSIDEINALSPCSALPLSAAASGTGVLARSIHGICAPTSSACS